MLRLRATESQIPVGGGSDAMYSGVWREMVVKRLQVPSIVGLKISLGG
jgi:hypothetical protein